jgi:hypothetical protein
MADKTEQSKQQPKNSLKRAGVIGLSLVVVIILVTGAFLVTKQHNKTDCSKITAQAIQSINSKKTQQAYDGLKAKSSECATPLNGQKFTVSTVRYQCSLALSAINSGKQNEAPAYAKTAIKAMNKLSNSEKSQIPNQPDVLVRLTLIAYGINPNLVQTNAKGTC